MALLDLIIIGAGPAGMTAAIYAKRKGLTLQLIADSVGGNVTKTGNVENYPGYKSIPGPQLAALIKKQLEDMKIDIKLSRVAKLEKAGDYFMAMAADGTAYEARAVVVATGSKWKELNVPGEKEFRNKGVSYCPTCDGPLFSGMDVAVIGGGNAAAEAVMDLIPMAKKIFLVVRSTLKADKVVVDKIQSSDKVAILMGYTVDRINGKDFVESVDIVSTSGGERKTLNVGGVFVEVGLLPNVAFAKDLLEINDRGEIVIDERCRTNVCGVFAAGDVSDVPQKQIIVAAGEGAKAAMSAFTYISTQKC
ncbi:MAG TPA: FAD-dependent oxidoreductase [Methanocella sp.]|uniref:NAD(P)/FAD-dependent oxidoreductase n=1 Tax=Methanocella sp. TaxID=2052833 RepID=UPI002CF5D511|nr:FAD-dependent oxidoreductase [Methanocella sp.]HTY91132.1 FAD-dependent oxidoreductase [Methanocella sp.]